MLQRENILIFISKGMFKVLKSILLFIVCIGLLTACSSEEVLNRGAEATVTKNTLIASDTDSYEELKDVVSNDNKVGILQLETAGKAAPIDEGIVVTVVDPVAGYHLVEIRLDDGSEWIIQEDALEQ
jgi:stalled ribosome rescue protein Dom34